MLELEGQIKMEQMCFSHFFKLAVLAEDSAARIEFNTFNVHKHMHIKMFQPCPLSALFLFRSYLLGA